MKIVITGASGNVGTGLLRRLRELEPAADVIGLCRRFPQPVAPFDTARWYPINLASPSLRELIRVFSGADAVVHLGWAIQPVANEPLLHRINIDGSRAVFRAAVTAGVPHLVYASSLAAYGPGEAMVGEDWPVTGIATSVYSRQKVAVERMLDELEAETDLPVITRMRPVLVAQRQAARRVATLFLTPRIPRAAYYCLASNLLPVIPLPAGLVGQLVHADDLGEAFVRVLRTRLAGAVNVAADPLDTRQLAALVGARRTLMPIKVARAAVTAAWQLHTIRLSPGWFDLAIYSPLLDTTRARTQLGWVPQRSSAQVGRELLAGLADGADAPSPAMRGQ